MTAQTHLDHLAEPIRCAYTEFKGGCETTVESRRMLNVVETARTNGVRAPDGDIIRNAVHVFPRRGITELPDIVSETADRHDLVEVKREHRYNSDEIQKVSYVREQDAEQ